MAAAVSQDGGAQAARSFVDVHAIEAELAELRWKLRPDGDFGEAAQHAAAEARASVLNLIAVVGSGADVDAMTRVLDKLSTHHPSRALILLAQDERAALKLEASVTAEARAESGHRVIVERVLLHAHGPVAQHLGSAVMPLLIPDLPVILWWPGRPDFGSELFNELTELSDRLIVDTDEGFELADLNRLLEVARRRSNRRTIGDFNWARLMPWRHLTAQFFDVESMLERLAHIEGVTVVCGTGCDIQARLLAGWIQCRMARHRIAVPREIRSDPELPAGVARLMIYSSGPEQSSRFSVIRERGGRLSTEIRIGREEQAGRTVRIPERRPEDLLAMELTLPGHDVLYEEALDAATSD